jgi:hypothetical protein
MVSIKNTLTAGDSAGFTWYNLLTADSSRQVWKHYAVKIGKKQKYVILSAAPKFAVRIV